MNTIDLFTWLQFFARLGIGLCAIAGLAFIVHALCKSSSWRRAIWQIALVCSLLIAIVEMTGASKGVGIWLFGKEAPQRVVTVKVFDPAWEFIRSFDEETVAVSSVPVSDAAFELPKNCWWPAMFWLAGGTLVLGRILFAQGVFLAFRSKRKRLTDAGLLANIKLLSEQLRLRRRVRVYELQRVSGPIAFGIARPSIGVPRGFTEQFTPAQQQAMLAHELAHLRSHDPFWYLIANIVTAVFWWHPGIWWMRRQLQAASEFAADEAVVLLENGPITLAECLVTFGRQLTASRPMNALGVGGFRSNLGKRVEALLNLKESPFHSVRAWPQTVVKMIAPICLVALLVCTVGWFENRETQRGNDFSATIQGSWGNSMAVTAFAAAKEEREMRRFLAQVEPESPQVTNSSSVQEVFRKLEEIRFPSFQPRDVTLQEAVKFLNDETIRLDPDKKGVRFTTTVTNSVRINLAEPLRNLVLQNVIRAIVVAADKPITFVVDAKGVVTFNEHQGQQAARYSEKFAIDLEKFESELVANGFEIDKRGYDLDDENKPPIKVWRTRPALPEYFIGQGVKINSGTVIRIFSDASQLMVHGVLEDVMAIENAVQKFRIEGSTALTTDAPQPLVTSIFKVDAEALLQRVSAAGIVAEPGKADISFNVPRVIGDFPNVQRGTDLRSIPDSRGGPSHSGGSSGIYIVTKTNAMQSNNDLLRKYFSKEGIELDPPKSLFLNDRSGELIVRASYAEIKAIGSILGSVPMENRGDAIQQTQFYLITIDRVAFLREAETHFSELGQKNTAEVIKDYFRSKGISRTGLDSLKFIESDATIILQGTDSDFKKITTFPGIKKVSIKGGVAKATAGVLAQEGKVLVESGKLDEAERKLNAALKIDPENKAAQYYLKLAQDLDFAKELRDREDRFIHPTNPPKRAVAPKENSASPPRPAPASTKTEGETNQLLTRSYKVDVNVMATSLGKLRGETKDSTGKTDHEVLREFFSKIGAEISSPKTLFYNDQTGALIVRATEKDFESVEKGVHYLNTPAPQITIEVKFAEFDHEYLTNSGDNWFLGSTLISSTGLKNAQGSGVPVEFAGAGAHSLSVAGIVATNSLRSTFEGIITPRDFSSLTKYLEGTSNADVLSAPKVTNLSGRHAQISVLDTRTLVTGLETVKDAFGNSTSNFKTEPVEFGPTLDVISTVALDKSTVNMVVISTLREFLGYEEPPQSLKKVSEVQGQVPLPRMRVRQITTSVDVPDRHTLVLGGLGSENVVKIKSRVPVLGSVPGLGRLFRSETVSKEKKHLIIFVTPTIMDNRGLPVNANK